MSPDAIAADCDLPVEAVQEAIAYCQSNPPEIQEDWEREEALMEATGMNDPDYKYHPTPRSSRRRNGRGSSAREALSR